VGFDPLHPDNLVTSSIRTVNDRTPTGTVDLFHPENSPQSASFYAPAPSPTNYSASTATAPSAFGDLHVHTHIGAMDSQDIFRRSKDIATAVQMAMVNSNHPIGRTILDRVNPR
jgi:hypothetical protein